MDDLVTRRVLFQQEMRLGEHGRVGNPIFFTRTVVPAWGTRRAGQRAQYEKVKAVLSELPGQLLSGLFHLEREPGAELEAVVFFLWELNFHFTTAAPLLVRVLDFKDDEELAANTNDGEAPYGGMIWDMPRCGGDILLGMSVYHLRVQEYGDTFRDGIQLKQKEISAIPGKSAFGYFFNKRKKINPEGFVIWSCEAEKDHGKGRLWDLMCANPEGAPTTHSVHTWAHGGMFSQDSDRRYHPGFVAVCSYVPPTKAELKKTLGSKAISDKKKSPEQRDCACFGF